MQLKVRLDALFADYHQVRYLSSDPLEFVHRYADPWDQEAVALVSALLAYGNVKQIRRSVEDLLVRMGQSPREFVRMLSPGADPERKNQSKQALKGFVHRFNRGTDLALLLELLARSWATYGSLGSHLLQYLAPPTEEEDFGPALSRLIGDWRGWAGKGGKEPSFSHLLTAPEDGSCCKRWCMLLRWMGRQDDPTRRLDLGLWNERSPLSGTFPSGRGLHSSQLVIPLDTHTGRLSQKLGLTRRKSLDWKAALEVTRNLKRFDSKDPVRYDFALCRLGMFGGSA